MSILEKLPPSYKFSPADADRGWEIFARYMTSEVTPEEMELSDFALKAEQMHYKSKRWPTVLEVAEQFQRENQERQKRREQSNAKNN
jgi:hypothetical protein